MLNRADEVWAPAQSAVDAILASGVTAPVRMVTAPIIENLARRIGDQIGQSLARALAEGNPAPARPGPARPGKRATCSREGCGRPAAARGLCKSHYNLMLYHRRKAAAADR